jgi:ubiquinone/menaquinone biosynthesis C-methylase UbiE
VAEGVSSEDVAQANVELHTRLAESYQSCEPHFRPENVDKVERKLTEVIAATDGQRLLDLGCGTGFIIDIAKSHVKEIHGVDMTPAMLERVDTGGPAEITLHQGDTGSFEPEEGSFDVVTAYSFLHHLYELGPTLSTAADALRSGGRFYADLEPNRHFWDAIGELERGGDYDPILTREIEMVTFKDEDIEKEFGVKGEVFNLAEWGKSTRGGFGEDELRAALADAGFAEVEFFYEWFVGQGAVLNEEGRDRGEADADAAAIDALLQRALPLSRSLFKYIGFVATR